MKTCECDNCGRVEPVDAVRPLSECADLGERLDPGATVPAGECSQCGCFTYLQEMDEQHECALCGAGDPAPGYGWTKNRRGELFCCRSHRDQSNRQLREFINRSHRT